MLTLHTVLEFVVGHVQAGAGGIICSLVFALGSYAVGLYQSVDGGLDTPVAEFTFFMTLMFTIGLFAVAMSIGSFAVSTLLIWLRTKRRYPLWVPVLAVPLVTLFVVLMVFGGNRDLNFMEFATPLTLVCFGVCWTLLAFSAAVLDFIRRKIVKSNPT
jgi:hypothetical protein